ncbi:myeloid cell surface antigen CD33-like [Artibeus jamaicensis]|uniref:myeloid cell surface antigen CD33-like n=1 Tax=Artibeus jamaicensis TaxID=9417 RepID=UPI00235A6A14|nr:myeloid cell surface antigen CD33-like [Artibeus jamaicensis]XP_053515739.1 myeloid cell surface antigen CD33-like [Artibeus jamaicensis]XP_053515740.1 myeloid cell surface antigen CD33-like [Artibeus jamaicensis]
MLPLLLSLLWAGSLVHSRRYQVRMQESLTVQEGLCAFVPCSIIYSWHDWSDSGHGYWYREGATWGQDVPVATSNRDREVQEETRGRFLLLEDPGNHNCSLDIRDARRTDEGLYHFQGERDYDVFNLHRRNMLFVRVTALNHIPDILIPGPLECGHPINLTCSVPWACERGTPPLFSWTSAAHTSLGRRTHNLSSVLTLTPRPQDHGTNLTCRVQFPAVGVTVERTIQLNVTCAPQSPAISISPGDSPGKKEPVMGCRDHGLFQVRAGPVAPSLWTPLSDQTPPCG